MSETLVQIVTTTDELQKAQSMALALVDERFVACVQIDGPIESRYRWQGNVETTKEWRLTIKTTRDACAEAMSRIRQLHTYETPEISVTAIAHCSPDYARWVIDQVGGPRES
jgi:periplasmic divalent cation tolerance protein